MPARPAPVEHRTRARSGSPGRPGWSASPCGWRLSGKRSWVRPFLSLGAAEEPLEVIVPLLARPLVLRDPRLLVSQPSVTQPAGPLPPDLLRGHQPGVFQHAHVLLDAREGHVEAL